MAVLRRQPSHRKKISMIECYLLNAHNEYELGAFYYELEEVVCSDKPCYNFSVGDYSTKIGKAGEGEYRIGKTGLGEKSENIICLAKLLTIACLFHSNSFNQKKVVAGHASHLMARLMRTSTTF
uniref:Acidic phosphoprotein PCEMA1 n=1 Tax=Angiostrongylus cantonensis TaxID=6313 RepID=A0A0K0D671_ANGCA